jgi:lysophospholipase L1-like esterase
MHTLWQHHRLALILCCVGVALLVFILAEVAWLRYNGTVVPRPTITRDVQQVGSGPALRFAILGDSTSVSQGSDYDEGYAAAAVSHLAQTYTVRWQNFGVSGARAHDVADKQAPEAAAFAPDIALLAVGANDVTHLTEIGTARQALTVTIQTLRKANADVRIVLTGSPDMGSPPRLPQPLRWLAGERTKAFNTMAVELVDQQNLTFAPIAAQTGPAFRKDPTLFAQDNFHPNADGYALWAPVVIRAIDQSLDRR